MPVNLWVALVRPQPTTRKNEGWEACPTAVSAPTGYAVW